MPELPDITIYVEALERHIIGRPLVAVRIQAPFLLRTFEPALDSVFGKTVREIRRIGKRIALGLDGELWLVLHLMIAGRLQWKPRGAKLSGKNALAAFDFADGTLLLTEAGSKRRAALYVLRGGDALAAQNPGGLEVLPATLDQFEAVLRRQNHTLKRALSDPRLFSGIGNAYSDEILHRARLSPLALSQKIAKDEVERLFTAVRDVLNEWIDTLRAESGEGFPEKVTAFRPGMAVHGRFGEPCPVCQALDPADPIRRQRDQLLPALSDGRPHPRRPLALAAAERRLAATPR